jgi:hypothetical protein
MPESSFAEMIEETRSLISALSENVAEARRLCEISYNLRCDTSDLREFLREARLAALNRWSEGRPPKQAGVPRNRYWR